MAVQYGELIKLSIKTLTCLKNSKIKFNFVHLIVIHTNFAGCIFLLYRLLMFLKCVVYLMQNSSCFKLFSFDI